MDSDKTQELLLQVCERLARIEAKLEAIDEQKLSSRIDNLEAENREHDRIIRSLEKRNNTMETFIRTNLNDSNKDNKAVWVGVGMAVFTSILSSVMNLL